MLAEVTDQPEPLPGYLVAVVCAALVLVAQTVRMLPLPAAVVVVAVAPRARELDLLMAVAMLWRRCDDT